MTAWTEAAGVVAALPASPIPLLEEVTLDDAAAIDAMTPAQRAKTVVLIRYALDSGKEPLASAEEKTKAIVEWARARGPFDAIGVRVDGADDATAAYAIKRLAVMARAKQATYPRQPVQIDERSHASSAKEASMTRRRLIFGASRW